MRSPQVMFNNLLADFSENPFVNESRMYSLAARVSGAYLALQALIVFSAGAPLTGLFMLGIAYDLCVIGDNLRNRETVFGGAVGFLTRGNIRGAFQAALGSLRRDSVTPLLFETVIAGPIYRLTTHR